VAAGMTDRENAPLTHVPSQPAAQTSESILRLLRVRFPIILIVAALSAVTASILASMQPARYRASAIAAIEPLVEKLPVGDQMRGVETLDHRTIVATAAALASTPLTIEPRLQQNGFPRSGYVIRAIPLPNTNLLRVEVEDSNPARAAAIANQVPLIIGQQTIAIFKFFDVKIVSPAGPGEQFSPRVARATAAGVVVGLFLGIAAAWAVEKVRGETPRRI
jgi:hypothetical protein